MSKSIHKSTNGIVSVTISSTLKPLLLRTITRWLSYLT